MKSTPVIAKIVCVGNTHGVRIPKSIREQLGLTGKVTITVTDGGLVIRAQSNRAKVGDSNSAKRWRKSEAEACDAGYRHVL